jgi:hypothetical protein
LRAPISRAIGDGLGRAAEWAAKNSRATLLTAFGVVLLRASSSLAGQFEQPYGPMGPPILFTIPVLRYHEDLWPDAKRGVVFTG